MKFENMQNEKNNQEEKEVGVENKEAQESFDNSETGNNQESNKEEVGKLQELDSLSPDNLAENEAQGINKKVEEKEYIEDPDLLKKADEAESAISQEIIAKQINDAEKYQKQEGFLRKLQKNKYFKGASKVVLAYMILFKANAAFGSENVEQDKVKDMKAVEFVDDSLGGDGNSSLDDNTFEASSSDLENNEDKDDAGKESKVENSASEDLESNNFEDSKASVLDIDQYFANNEADISQEGQDQALGHTLNFFSDMAGDDGQMDRDKLREFMDNEIKIKASANELSRVGGNEELSIDRGEALKSILSSEDSLEKISNHLSELGLTEGEVEKVLEKFTNAKIEIPHSDTGPEAGVTYITDMENPDTGENYTAEEVEDIKANDLEKYQKLLAEARSVKIDLSAEPEKDIEKMESKPAESIDSKLTIEKLTPKSSEMKNYQEILIGADNSGSTHDDNEAMTKVLHENFNDIKRSATDSKIENIKVASFDDKLGNVKNYDVEDSDKAFDRIYDQESKGDSWERAVDAALKLVDKADKDKQSLCYIETDEKIQDVSASEIQELKDKCAEKNVEIKFLLKPDKIVDENGEEVKTENDYVEIGLEELSQSVEGAAQEQIDNVHEKLDSQTWSDEDRKEELKQERAKYFQDKNRVITDIELDNGVTLKWNR